MLIAASIKIIYGTFLKVLTTLQVLLNLIWFIYIINIAVELIEEMHSSLNINRN